MSRARDIADIGEDVTSLATDAELSSGLASKLPYSFGTATPSTTDSGFLWYDSNSTPAAPKFWDGAAFQALTSGKILQVVRAVDNTTRSSTSTSVVDVTGMSVTITPQKSDSTIVVMAVFSGGATTGTTNEATGTYRITDASNNVVSGGGAPIYGVTGYTRSGTAQVYIPVVLVGFSTPATTSAVTYKLRYSAASGATIQARNGDQTGQMIAYEVAA